MRDAYSILDQVIALSGDTINVEDVDNITGSVGVKKTLELVNLIENKDISNALGVINELVNLGKDAGKIVNNLLEFYKDTIIYDMEFNSNSLIAYADGKMMSIRPNAKEDWVYNYGEKILNRYMRGSRDTRMLMFDNQNNAELSVISLNGRETHKISTEVIADFGDIYNGYIIYNSERNLYLAQLDGTLLAKYVASRDIKKAYFIDDDNILVVYNTSFEFLHIERNN